MRPVALSRRLAMLEERYRRRNVCRSCHGYPVRIVGIDPDTDAVTSEMLPADGCPVCGTAIIHELRIVGMDAEEV